MFRRRFKLSYNNVGDGVYAVNKNLRLIPVSEADNTCIGIALVYDRHSIMIEKNEDSNQSYKDASAGYNRNYLFYWGGYTTYTCIQAGYGTSRKKHQIQNRQVCGSVSYRKHLDLQCG